ncbi:MAG: nucleotide exchange factor GrpE [Lentisphaeria bacterium]|nr:nucleotide exchange factor GrpE [Lentisphaeria bacterium]
MSENKENTTQENITSEVPPQGNDAQEWKDASGAAAKEEAPLSEVDKLKAELAAQQEKFVYLQAEYQNFRKRAARDISDARSHAIADTLTPFLSVSDFLGMAQTAAEKTDNLDAIKQGLTMIIAQFDKALEEMSVRKFSAVGEKFNPDLHDAVGREPSDSIPEGVITKEWNCGYKIGEKLLRPARVMVSSGPEVPEEKENSEKE